MKGLRWVGNLLAMASVLFFLYLALASPEAFARLSLDLITGLKILVAVAAYVLAMTVGAMVWLMLVRGAGEELMPVAAVTTVFLSQAAKYIPGNVAHHVGRVVLARRHGLSMTATLFSMFMETVWVIAVAAMLAVVALWSVGNRVFEGIPQIPEWWTLAGLIVLAMLAPLLGHRLFERAARWWAVRKGMDYQAIRLPSLRVFWSVGGLYVLNYLVLGLVLWIIATQVFDTAGGSVLLLSGIFAVAWIVGFITPGAPAGLGVREVVLVAALTPVYDQQTAIGIAAVLRVVTVLGDGLAFLVGLALSRWAMPVAATVGEE